MRRALLLLTLIYGTGLSGISHAFSQANIPQQLRFPPGFKLEQVARVENARQMSLAPDGSLFVGSRQAGKVYRLRDDNGDGHYEQQQLIMQKLQMPSGIAFHQGALYIADLNRILKLDNALADTPGPQTLLSDHLPDKQHHGWKYLKVGADNRLYFNIGAPCNVCLREDPRFATLARMPLKGGSIEVIARGVRNSVGFAWHPQDGALWFTDNGRDWMGDDRPDDELNRLDRVGQHFGFPYIHGDNLPDPQFSQLPVPEHSAPRALLGPHVAALGMTFSQQPPWAEKGETSAFIALHGSWNRSEKVGYQVLKVRLKGNEVISIRPFIYGWLQGQRHSGRPVDVLFDYD
ncbi:MAG: PQQ-dependent sugar dehydrogenase, partial [Porticoccaceae bacterium]|nr:PQQ-dependent sugar dehydrogenase [Porticoccaceae bacterium]